MGDIYKGLGVVCVWGGGGINKGLEGLAHAKKKGIVPGVMTDVTLITWSL